MKSAPSKPRKAARKSVPSKSAQAKKTAGTKKSPQAKKAVPPRKSAPPAAPRAGEPLAHRLDALLHTIRCIAQHEDELCTLLHDVRRSGRANTSLVRELQGILEHLPDAHEYTFDLDALRGELDTAA